MTASWCKGQPPRYPGVEDVPGADAYGNAKPIGIGMVGGFLGRALAQEKDVRDHGRAFTLEGVGRQADRTYEVGPLGKVFADGGILFVEREVRRDQCQHTARSKGIDGLGEEIIVQR